MKQCARNLFVLFAAVAFVGIGAESAFGWGAVEECMGCHSGFRDGSPSLHSLHIDNINSCQDCHAASVSDPLRTNESANYAEYSCNGCHEVEGLATVHGDSFCGPCHTGVIGTSEGENVLPYFYTEGRSSVVNTCRLDPANGGEDWDGDGQGLDNDGDGAYDAADSDCDGIVETDESTWTLMKALFGAE